MFTTLATLAYIINILVICIFKFGSSMMEIKRDSNEDIRTNSSAPKNLRQKDVRMKPHPLRGKEVFLTDNQTDQTKSSNEAKAIDIEKLEQEVRRLERENTELREGILKLKANQFYGINEQKVKNLIRENQNFKSEMRILRNQLQKTMMEKDFLERNNRILKEKYEEFTKENSKNVINSRLKTEQSRIKDYELIEDIEEFLKENRGSSKSKRSTSGERRKMLKKKVFNTLTNKPEEKSNPESKKHKEQQHQTPHFNEEYYLLRHAKSNPKKSYP